MITDYHKEPTISQKRSNKRAFLNSPTKQPNSSASRGERGVNTYKTEIHGGFVPLTEELTNPAVFTKVEGSKRFKGNDDISRDVEASQIESTHKGICVRNDVMVEYA